LQYKKIKYIGGDSVQKMISNIFTYCITFEVGHKLSWTGAKNTVAIENSTFADTIIGNILCNKRLSKCIFQFFSIRATLLFIFFANVDI